MELIYFFDFHRSKSTSSSELLQSFKYIRIIEMLNNYTVRHLLLPTCALIFPAIQRASAYVCIKLHDTLSWPALLFYGLIYCDALILTTSVFLAPCHVFTSSRQILLKWKTGWKMGRKSEMRKELKALVPIKVRCGSNFVDNSTPLVLQDMCTRQTVSSLLISR
jgi:hypothetical protein